MPNESCLNCRFWFQWQPDSASPNHGDCRRESPKVIGETDPSTGYIKARTKYPSQHLKSWCGDYQLLGGSRPPFVPPVLR